MEPVSQSIWYDTVQGREIADAAFESLGLNKHDASDIGKGLYSNEELARKFLDIKSFFIFIGIVSSHIPTSLSVREIASKAADIYGKFPVRY